MHGPLWWSHAVLLLCLLFAAGISSSSAAPWTPPLTGWQPYRRSLLQQQQQPQQQVALPGAAGRASTTSSRTSGSTSTSTTSSSSGSGSGSYLPLCSATINYGASVGDSSKQQAAEVPIFVGSFSLVSQQAQASPVSSWVLGWQFAGGERILVPRDVFGDDGTYNVFLSDTSNTSTSSSGSSGAGKARAAGGSSGQAVAVLSNTTMASAEDQVTFSFVGRKGPPDAAGAVAAPFRVAPPAHLFFNNHFCLPLVGAAGAAVPASPAATGSTTGQSALAVPALPEADQPQQMVVDYMPVELVAGDTGETALFAKTFTQFYFKIANKGAAPVRLDQLLLQYWFEGPDNMDATSSTSPDNPTSSAVTTAAAASQALLGGGGGTAGVNGTGPDAVAARAALAAAQMRMVCNDATPGLGCGALEWSITTGLPGVKGARYVLSIWLNPASTNATTTTSSSAGGSPQVLLPSAAADSSNSSSGLGVASFEAIVFLEPRRFFSKLNATEDYSFLDTPLLPQPEGQDGNGSKVVRRQRLPNRAMPVYVGDRLAWGSPPQAGPQVAAQQPNSSSSSRRDLPPGSYCQPSNDGGQVCGVSMVYCCFGSTPLSSTVPQDWTGQLLAAGTTAARGVTDSVVDPGQIDTVPQVNTSSTLVGLPAGSSPGAGDGSSAQQQQPAGSSTTTVVLATVLPSLALLVALALFGRFLARHSSAVAAGQSPAAAKRSYSWFSACGSASDAGSTDDPEGGQYRSEVGQPAVSSSRRGSWMDVLHGFRYRQGDSLQQGLLPTSVGPHGQHAVDHVLTSHASVVPSVGYTSRVMLTGEELLQLEEVGAKGTSAAPDASPWRWDKYDTAPVLPGVADAAAAVATVPGKMSHGSNSSSAGQTSKHTAAATVLEHQGGSGKRGRGLFGRWSMRCKPSDKEAAAAADDPCNAAAHGSAGSSSATTPQQPPPAAGVSGAQCSSCAQDDPRVSSSISRCRGYHTWTGILSEDAFAAHMLDPFYINSLILRRHTAGGWPPGVSVTPPGAAGLHPAPDLPPGLDSSPGAVTGWLAGVAAGSSVLGLYPTATPAGGAAGAGNTRATATAAAAAALAGALTMPGVPPVPLDVDFKAEIKPHLGRLLGKGGYGQVYEAEWRGQKVAVKLLSVDAPELLEDVIKEVALSACFRASRHVVKLLGACLTDPSCLALIMELVEGGNLAQRIHSPSKRRLTYLEVLQLGWDIAAGLAYLHPAVVHRDLKPQNVLLDSKGRAKIADFGISRFKDPHRSYLSVTHAGGTPNYMAPELFNGARVDEAADVYSLACILYEAWGRRPPFAELAEGGEDKSYNVLYKIIVAVAINQQRPPLPADMPPGLASLITSCWEEDPRARPPVAALLDTLDRLIQEEVTQLAAASGLLQRLARTRSSGSTRSSTSNGANGAASSSHPGLAALGAGGDKDGSVLLAAPASSVGGGVGHSQDQVQPGLAEQPTLAAAGQAMVLLGAPVAGGLSQGPSDEAGGDHQGGSDTPQPLPSRRTSSSSAASGVPTAPKPSSSSRSLRSSSSNCSGPGEGQSGGRRVLHRHVSWGDLAVAPTAAAAAAVAAVEGPSGVNMSPELAGAGSDSSHAVAVGSAAGGTAAGLGDVSCQGGRSEGNSTMYYSSTPDAPLAEVPGVSASDDVSLDDTPGDTCLVSDQRASTAVVHSKPTTATTTSSSSSSRRVLSWPDHSASRAASADLDQTSLSLPELPVSWEQLEEAAAAGAAGAAVHTEHCPGGGMCGSSDTSGGSSNGGERLPVAPEQQAHGLPHAGHPIAAAAALLAASVRAAAAGVTTARGLTAPAGADGQQQPHQWEQMGSGLSSSTRFHTASTHDVDVQQAAAAVGEEAPQAQGVVLQSVDAASSADEGLYRSVGAATSSSNCSSSSSIVSCSNISGSGGGSTGRPQAYTSNAAGATPNGTSAALGAQSVLPVTSSPAGMTHASSLAASDGSGGSRVWWSAGTLYQQYLATATAIARAGSAGMYSSQGSTADSPRSTPGGPRVDSVDSAAPGAAQGPAVPAARVAGNEPGASGVAMGGEPAAEALAGQQQQQQQQQQMRAASANAACVAVGLPPTPPRLGRSGSRVSALSQPPV